MDTINIPKINKKIEEPFTIVSNETKYLKNRLFCR
jgi:hypothetical protein